MIRLKKEFENEPLVFPEELKKHKLVIKNERAFYNARTAEYNESINAYLLQLKNAKKELYENSSAIYRLTAEIAGKDLIYPKEFAEVAKDSVEFDTQLYQLRKKTLINNQTRLKDSLDLLDQEYQKYLILEKDNAVSEVDILHIKRKILDVGTGTGILGMAAVLFGSGEVLGIDNDPDAVKAAEENVVRNGLQKSMQVSLAPLSALAGEYQVVVANIVHDILLDISTDLTRLTANNGVLILSGILVGEQVESVVSRFVESGFVLKKEKARGEWVALMFAKGA